MSSEPLTIIICTPESFLDEFQKVAATNRRDELRSQLRVVAAGLLRVPTARMSYAPARYARLIVALNGYKLVGWPPEIPFVDLSDILGGAEPFEKLLACWHEGSLRIDPATDDEREAARRDPMLVHPNPPPKVVASAPGDGKSGQSSAKAETSEQAVAEAEVEAEAEVDAPADGQMEAEAAAEVMDVQAHASQRRAPAVVVPALVFDSQDMRLLGYQLTSTQPSVAELGERPRCQRSDMKKPRPCYRREPDKYPQRLPKAGIKSSRYALRREPEVDSQFERYAGSSSSSPESTSKRRKLDPIERSVDDPLDEIRGAITMGADVGLHPDVSMLAGLDEIESVWESTSEFGSSAASDEIESAWEDETESSPEVDGAVLDEIETASEDEPRERSVESEIEDADNW